MSAMIDGLLLLGLIAGVDPAPRTELPIQMAQANPPLTWSGLGIGIKRFYQTYHGLNWPTRGGEQNPFNWNWIAARFDADGNGTITAKELGAPPEWFDRLDRTRDGRLTEDDFDWSANSTIERQTRSGRTTFRSMDADGNGKLTPEEWQAAFSKASQERGFLTDDELTRLLYSNAGAARSGAAPAGARNPAGSGGRPSAGASGTTTWGFEANTKIGIVVPEPRTMKEREAVSVRFCVRLQPKCPILVDEIDDRVGRTYCAMPIRLYIVDTNGRIVYKAGVGPFGYNPNEMEQALILHLLDERRLASERQTAAKP